MTNKQTLPKQKIKIAWSQKIDWNEIYNAYLQSSIMWVQAFLVKERGWSDWQAKSWNTTKQTVWRQFKKIEVRKELEAKSLDILKAEEVQKRVENTKLLFLYYQANTKAILKKVQDAQNKPETLSLKDRIDINREIRTQLWLPNNITWVLPQGNIDDNLENPAQALLDIIDWDYEVQTIDARTDWGTDEKKGSTN